MNVNYKNLKIWQRSVNFCTAIYMVSKAFPESEKFGLTNQLRRAAISIPVILLKELAENLKLIFKGSFVSQKAQQMKLKRKLLLLKILTLLTQSLLKKWLKKLMKF